jgi:hypothetical protein
MLCVSIYSVLRKNSQKLINLSEDLAQEKQFFFPFSCKVKKCNNNNNKKNLLKEKERKIPTISEKISFNNSKN